MCSRIESEDLYEFVEIMKARKRDTDIQKKKKYVMRQRTPLIPACLGQF